MRTKTQLRLELKERLSSITASEYDQFSRELSVHLNKFLNDIGVIQRHLVIAAFAPIEKEPKWFLCLDEAVRDLTAFPAVTEEGMIFKKTRLEELEPNWDFGVKILGPVHGSLAVVPDIVLVPGLGFSEKGERLGRGKGYYDKALEKSAGLKIGIAFEKQIQSEIPVDEHDVLMNFIITEKRVIKIT